MNLLAAIFLVTVVLCDAEPPRFPTFQRQQQQPQAAPYPASGWKPQGAQFSLPQKSYGPPSSTQSPETTTELPETTTESVVEDTTQTEPQAQAVNLKSNEQQQQTPVYLVVPESQNYLYTIQQQSSPLRLATIPQVATTSVLSSRLEAIPLTNNLVYEYNPYQQVYYQIYK